jgi:hypothetical protein
MQITKLICNQCKKELNDPCFAGTSSPENYIVIGSDMCTEENGIYFQNYLIGGECMDLGENDLHFCCKEHFVDFFFPEDIKKNRGEGISLDTPLEDLEFPVRAYRALKSDKINTFEDLTRVRRRELKKIRNVGYTTIRQIEDLLESQGYKLK